MKKFKDVIKQQRDHIEFLRTEGKDLVYDDTSGCVFKADEEVYRKYLECASRISQTRISTIGRGVEIDAILAREHLEEYAEKAIVVIMNYKGKPIKMELLDEILIQAHNKSLKMIKLLGTVGVYIWDDI